MSKCRVNKNLSIDYCLGMQEAFGRRMNNNQGLRSCDYHNLESNNFSRNGVVLKNGAKDRGLMLNYCPFCGVSIATHEAKDRRKPVGDSTGRTPGAKNITP